MCACRFGVTDYQGGSQRQFHAKNTQTLCVLCVFFASLREKWGVR
jgi:hypothetical protein